MNTTSVTVEFVLWAMTMIAGFGLGALWMDAIRTTQRKDKRAAKRSRVKL